MASHFLGRSWKSRITGIVLITGHGDWSRLGSTWLSFHDRVSDRPEARAWLIATPLFAFFFFLFPFVLGSTDLHFRLASRVSPHPQPYSIMGERVNKPDLWTDGVSTLPITYDKTIRIRIRFSSWEGSRSAFSMRKIMGLHGTPDYGIPATLLRD